MAVNLVTVTGNLETLIGATPTAGRLWFKLNRPDWNDAGEIFAPEYVEAVAATDGSFTIDLQSTADFENGATYSAILKYFDPTDGKPKEFTLSTFALPTGGPFQLGDLLALASGGGALLEFQFANRAALVAKVASGLVPIPGFTYLAGGLSYLGKTGSTDIPDLPGMTWAGDRTPFHFGWVGGGDEADQKRGNLALTFPGKTVIDRPGTYFFGNSNPIADSFPTGDEDECDWWAMRRAWYIGRDDVVFEIGAGVNFIAASGSDCHFIQIGQPEITVRNGAGADIGTTTHVDCDNVQVIGARPDVDMNGDNQTAATADDYHFAGVWIQDGSTNVRVTGLSLRDGNYYGIGGEGNFAGAGFSDIYIGDNDITNFPADGIDFKDFGSDSNGIVIENNRLALVAYGTGFSSAQAAIDVRNGATVRGNIIDFTDAFAGDREAIRAQSGTAGVESDIPTQIVGNTILGNGGAGLTRGIRVIAGNVTTRSNEIRDMHTGIWVTSPLFSSSQDSATDCAAHGLILDDDASAGWAADNADINGFTARSCVVGIRFEDCDRASLTNCHVIGGTTGWQIAATAAGTRIIGGQNTATTRLSRTGSGSLVISDVQGFTTEAAPVASIPINTTGVKTVTVAHGLSFTPGISEIQVTLQQGSAVSDFVLAFPPMVSAVDATNVTIVTNVTTASASGTAVFARVTINGFQR